jgi:opacity protein-like surface antigen
MLRGALLCLAMTVGAAIGTAAAAEDNDHPRYIRLGIGLSDTRSTSFADQDCTATSPAALFGCDNGPDGNPIGAYGSFGSSVLFEGAWGQDITNWLRGEVALGYRPDLNFSGQSNFSDVTLGTEPVDATGRNITLMANAYLELSDILGMEQSSVHPFLSGGVGVAFNRTSAVTYSFPSLGAGDATITQGGSTTDFAWSLGAGIGIDLTDRLGLELAYRYIDLGDVATAPGDIRIVRAGRDDLLIPVDATVAALKAHEFLFSLIYRY